MQTSRRVMGAALVALGVVGTSGTALARQAGAGAAAQQQQVDPQMQAVLDAHEALKPTPPHQVSPEVARQGVTAKDAVEKVLKDQGKPATPEPVAKVEDKRIPGPGGNMLDVRVYTPGGAGPHPGVVYFHGGGFVVAGLDVYDAGPRALANQAKAVVVSVHYRQAPEHRFPAAVDDAAAAFRYVAEHPTEFGVDAKRLAVAGESAGGNLALNVARRQKDAKVKPVFQVLVYPFVSNDLKSPSQQQNGQGNYLVGSKDLGWMWKNYLGAGWEKSRNPEALPIYASAAQLQGLPPALVIAASLDPLLSEDEQLAKNLQAAGVGVVFKRYDGVTHEFFGMGAVVDKAKEAQADAGSALRAAFAQKPGVGGAGGGR